MKVFETTGHIHAEINFLKSQGKTIGVVPTMGALHQGHLTLIKKARETCDVVVCSIFVNPLQFNNPDDYKKYPSTIVNDTRQLEEAGCHLLFHPNYEQVYGQSKPRTYELGALDEVMEGHFRPGHFQGVANVVMRLFEILQPDVAFFGLKDYQQYMVIKAVTAKLMPGVKIMGVTTIREENGLAMSSRNMRLSDEEKKQAARVPVLLQQTGAMLGNYTIEEIKSWFEKEINRIPGFRYEYLELADGDTLQPVTDPSAHSHIRAFTAFYAGEVRLIDNMAIKE